MLSCSNSQSYSDVLLYLRSLLLFKSCSTLSTLCLGGVARCSGAVDVITSCFSFGGASGGTREATVDGARQRGAHTETDLIQTLNFPFSATSGGRKEGHRLLELHLTQTKDTQTHHTVPVRLSASSVQTFVNICSSNLSFIFLLTD